jgi:hypothetical protein
VNKPPDTLPRATLHPWTAVPAQLASFAPSDLKMGVGASDQVAPQVATSALARTPANLDPIWTKSLLWVNLNKIYHWAFPFNVLS